MRINLFFLFLAIFLTACLESEETNSQNALQDDNRGQAVMASSHCQTLGVIEPDQVRKHELPFDIQNVRDYCQSLVLAPEEEFLNTHPYYQCQLAWSTTDSAVNDQLKTDIDNLIGAPVGDTIEREGNINPGLSDDGNLRTIDLFFSYHQGQAELYWKIEDLWPALRQKVDSLTSLEWRLDLQSNNSRLCSEEGYWGEENQEIFVDGIEKCDGQGQARKYDYIFDLSGRLLSEQNQEISSDLACQ